MHLPSLAETFSRKKVLITGHTGFKGSWLCEWLIGLGAEVSGFALPAPTVPALFDQLELQPRLARHELGDIRDLAHVCNFAREVQPDFVFHLAAQPLVRLSYSQPVETYSTNIMGTANVLEAVRLHARPCSVVAVTTDKCYENREWLHAYREEDPMGGYDPYSASKGAAELVVSSYRRSFFSPSSGVRVASARAGNVIGGGDWALDRIIPDCVRALGKGEVIPVRNKTATRPWQHVLEPLSGYLRLASALSYDGPSPVAPEAYQSAFNFGPSLDSNRTVHSLVLEILKHWPGRWEDQSDPNAPHEAEKLNLATDKAFHLLDWTPAWSFEEAVRHTMCWYQSSQTFQSGEEFRRLTHQQILEYGGFDSIPVTS